nr:hypothetical protein [Spiroplasma citri]
MHFDYKMQPKWYAWDPAKNPNQNDLIVPSIDGKPNPKYDPEVNPETGKKLKYYE